MAVGTGDDADSESRARMSSTTGGKWKLIVGIGDGNSADSESLAVGMTPRGLVVMRLTVGIGDVANSESLAVGMPPRGLLKLTVGVGDDNDDNWRAIRINSAG